MPSDSYRDNLIKRLEKDSDYASRLLETVLEEALKDGYMDALPLTLEDVIEATNNRGEALSQVDIRRQALYQRLANEKTPLTKEATLLALNAAGFSAEMKLLEPQLTEPYSSR